MYVHRACKLSEQELDKGKKAGGFCANCGQSGTIFHVKGTIDYYQHVLNGVLYNVADGIQTTPMSDVWAREKLNLAKMKAARKGENWTGEEAESTPVTETALEAEKIIAEHAKVGIKVVHDGDVLRVVETVPEAESTEETEAVEEVIDEALEAVIEEAAEIEKAPEETEAEDGWGEIPPTDHEEVSADPRIAAMHAETEPTEEEARNAEIARLRAELAELEPEAEK